MRWNANPEASAAAAQATADAALPAAGVLPWASAATYGRLTHQPCVAGTPLTSTAEAGRIVYFPCSPAADIVTTRWAIEQTNTPVGTTLQVHVARYARLADGTPGALVADYSANPITLLNAAPTLVESSAFAAVTIPKGDWCLAVLFLGTNGGTPPVLRTLTGHPGVGAGLLQSLNTNGGWRSPDTTNLAFPTNAVVNLADQGRGGILLYGRRP